MTEAQRLAAEQFLDAKAQAEAADEALKAARAALDEARDGAMELAVPDRGVRLRWQMIEKRGAWDTKALERLIFGLQREPDDFRQPKTRSERLEIKPLEEGPST